LESKDKGVRKMVKKIDVPLVSIIISSYNEEKFIERCLECIYNQDYSKNRIEIIIVDNESTDKTIKIIQNFSKKQKIKLFFNKKSKNPEVSKLIGLKKAKGDLIYFGDVDVFLEDKNWLSEMCKPYIENEDIFASECNWGYLENFSKTSKYCALLQIADPMARIMSKRDKIKIRERKDYNILTFSKSDNPILYCVLWNNKYLKKVFKEFEMEGSFKEGSAPVKIIRKDSAKIAKIKKVKAYHYYVSNFKDFINKRKKIAKKFLSRKNLKEESWTDKKSNKNLFWATFYCFSFILPLLEGIKNIFRDKTFIWLIHPFACFTTASIYLFYFIKNKFKEIILK
jgi:glycosyltransferase involved in cell wall biosynthesis